MCASITAIDVAAENGTRPDTISYNITPTAYTSAAGVTGFPCACSGAM
jgi:hypothetical protein